jgi:hypothetical protein
MQAMNILKKFQNCVTQSILEKDLTLDSTFELNFFFLLGSTFGNKMKFLAPTFG